MYKVVNLSAAAYNWLSRHRFVSEDAIISIVLCTPQSERKYSDKEHFNVTARRKKNKHFISITLWVHERETSYFVWKLHCVGV
jgi:hypothetical protein